MDLSHVGAFLSGVGAVVSAMIALRKTRQRAEAECQERIKEVKLALHEGYRMRDE